MSTNEWVIHQAKMQALFKALEQCAQASIAAIDAARKQESRQPRGSLRG